MRRLLLVTSLIGLATLLASFRSNTVSAANNAHAYFNSLAAHPNVWKTYSLRDQEQLLLYRHRRKADPAVTYDPGADTYPQKQDAAKVVMASDSLSNQLRLPLNIVGGSALITWDSWWGREYVTRRGQLNIHKNFMIASAWDNSERFLEIRSRYDLGSDGVAEVDARSYWPHRPPESLGGQSRMLPIAGSFVIQPATWTRYYVLWESVPDAADKMSLWVADEMRDATPIYDRVSMDAAQESLTTLWIEFNSSQNRDVALGPLIAYARNVVVLRNVTNSRSLFQRPLADGAGALSSPQNLRIIR